MENEIIEAQENSPTLLIKQAIDKGAHVEIMERLLAMRRELKAEHAKEEYDKAMSSFQSECPEIKKTKGVKTKSGQLAYKYAPIESIVKQVKSLLKENGFSYAIQTETAEKRVKSTCIIKHNLGHSESSSMEVPLGTKTPVMSDSQVVAAALTFAKRYAFCNSLGILTGDEDSDSIKEELQQDKPKFAKPQNATQSTPKKESPLEVKREQFTVSQDNITDMIIKAISMGVMPDEIRRSFRSLGYDLPPRITKALSLGDISPLISGDDFDTIYNEISQKKGS